MGLVHEYRTNMSTSNTPTSPAVRPPTQPKSSSSSLGTFVSVVIVAIVAGVSGALIVQSYPVSWPGAQFVHFTAQYSSEAPGIVYMDRGSDANGATLVKLLQAHQTKTVVSVFPQTTSAFTDERELGKGIIVSSDGWIAMVSKVLDTLDATTDTVSIVLHDGRTFTSDTFIQDTYTGMTFVHIPATQLPTADFRTTDVEPGESAVLFTSSIPNGDRFDFGHMESTLFHGNEKYSTRQVNAHYLVDVAGRPEYLGGPVFDEQGQVIGLSMLDHQVMPVSVISQLLYPIFSAGEIVQRTINIEYIPLHTMIDSTTGSTVNSTTEFLTGAKITVIHAGGDELKAGDIVTEIDGVTIDGEHDLGDIVHNIEVGRVVDVDIIRNGKQLTVSLSIE